MNSLIPTDGWIGRQQARPGWRRNWGADAPYNYATKLGDDTVRLEWRRHGFQGGPSGRVDPETTGAGNQNMGTFRRGSEFTLVACEFQTEFSDGVAKSGKR
ncbi:hypothetical protein CH63R_08127 [Colletotrichum higginsianum IMI 349063]|uniref:Uncharacterized protein n=1 Tax=Colletotrichum higginsianum (strain IMI 349063) TaxID=759273 RepID=A0A1B7YBB6_COLHI|nr:hypothetical protein CH63R_08127 [Colletotrichum higginsianum IMI 349063]OBR09362.1 hypothetical protein CH63R_08127 [Colletotrichum higginsianum IMI 349063]